MFVALFSSTGCSLFSAPTSTSLALPVLNEPQNWEVVQTSPYVYQHTDATQGKTFLTAIRDCQGKKPRSPAEAARQLLVGLKDIRIEDRQEVRISDRPALRSRVRAKLEEQPLELLTYTLTGEGCTFDFVLWRPNTENGNEVAPLLETDRAFENHDAFAQLLNAG